MTITYIPTVDALTRATISADTILAALFPHLADCANQTAKAVFAAGLANTTLTGGLSVMVNPQDWTLMLDDETIISGYIVRDQFDEEDHEDVRLGDGEINYEDVLDDEDWRILSRWMWYLTDGHMADLIRHLADK